MLTPTVRRVALLVALTLLGFGRFFSFPDGLFSRSAALRNQGPLTAFLVDAGSAPPACRSAQCTVTVVVPAPAVWRLRQQLRYISPPTQWIDAPLGRVFTRYGDGPYKWTTFANRSYETQYRIDFSSATATRSGEILQLKESLTVLQPGYVRSAKVVGADQQILLDRDFVKAEAPKHTGGTNRSYSALQFQPVPLAAMEIEYSELPTRLPQSGSWVRLHVTPPSSEPGAGPSDGGIDAQVVSVLLGDGLPRLVLRISPGESQMLLEERVTQEQATQVPAFAPIMTIDWTPANGGNSGPPVLRVPSSALVRDADGVRVWAVVADFAVPLQLNELEPGQQYSLVTELAGAQGLSIRAADWRALPGVDRAAIFKAANQASVLRSQPQLVSHPEAGLTPGIRLRARP